MIMETPPVLLHDAFIVDADSTAKGSLLLLGGRIGGIFRPDADGKVMAGGHALPFDMLPAALSHEYPGLMVSVLTGRHIMSGGVDAHVHFRDPGLVHKGDFLSESGAAVLGGVTSVIDMPNTVPPTVSREALRAKAEAAKGRSRADFGFHIGATDGNFDEILRMTEEAPESFAGIKVFMGSSTGNMLVNDDRVLERIFSIKGKPVLVHCEDEATIKANLKAAGERYGDAIPFSEHPDIRSRRACILSTVKALELAIKYGTRMHLCHISTAEEVEMARAAKAINPGITAETSVNYMWFADRDYPRLGSRIKCNPSIKTAADAEAIAEAVRNGIIDTIGSDHAPHLLSEKSGNYMSAPSGIPSVQYSLTALLTIADRLGMPLSRVAAVFSANPARIFGLPDKGKIGIGAAADLAVFDASAEFSVRREDIAGKCGWSPYEGETFKGKIESVYLAGEETVCKGTVKDGAPAGKLLTFAAAK